MGFLKQENWSRLLFSSPRDLPGPRVKPASPAVRADSIQLSHWESPQSSLKVKVAKSGPTLFYSPWDSPGQNTGVGSLFLLQGIFPAQGSNPGLLHCRQILYQLSHKGSPRILEWVAYPFSSGSSQSSNWIGVSCIAGGFFTNWATREAQKQPRGEHFFECNWVIHYVLWKKNLWLY